jgi:hypothetical protein
MVLYILTFTFLDSRRDDKRLSALKRKKLSYTSMDPWTKHFTYWGLWRLTATVTMQHDQGMVTYWNSSKYDKNCCWCT